METEWFCLMGVLLCSAHLCLGFWCGCRVSQGKTNERAPRPKPPFYMSDMLELIEHSRQLHRTFAPHQHQLPAGLMPAVLQVFQAAETLHKRVSSGPLSPSTGLGEPFTPPLKLGRIQPAGSSLSKQELLSFALDAQCTRAISEGSLASDRRPYDTCQNIAFFSQELPAPHDFEEVQCNDLSVDGISFFLDRRPEQDRLVISLGTPPELLFMTAQVVSSVLTYRDGDTFYRVGCRFLKRVESPWYQWNHELGVIDSLRDHTTYSHAGVTTSPSSLRG